MFADLYRQVFRRRVINQLPLTLVETEELLNLHRGQGMELFWRENLRCPSEEEYLEMVSNSECFYRQLAALQ